MLTYLHEAFPDLSSSWAPVALIPCTTIDQCFSDLRYSPWYSDSVGLGWGQRICLSNKFPDAATTVALGIRLGESVVWWYSDLCLSQRQIRVVYDGSVYSRPDRLQGSILMLPSSLKGAQFLCNSVWVLIDKDHASDSAERYLTA